MSYSSSLFVFFVSLTLLGLVLIPMRFRNSWISIMSLLWFASWHPLLPIFLSLLIALNFVLAQKKATILLILTNLTVFLMLRLTDVIPSLGSSFYLLILTGVSLASMMHPRNFAETFFLCTYFPLMMAGPVVREISPPVVNAERIFDGVLVFAVGWLKFQFLVLPLTQIKYFSDALFIQVLILTFQIYLTLSSFSDMGRGVSKMLGFDIPPAFRPVLFSRNPADFWNRWNYTVSEWFRDFLILPSLLRWGRQISPALILILGFVSLGLWHGFAVHWIVFGLFNGLMIVVWNRLRRTGRFLALLTLFGNGFIQLYGKANVSQPLWITNLYRRSWLEESATSFSIGIMVLLIFEILQELLKENDFFLRAPVPWKRGTAIVLLLLWMWAADLRAPESIDVLPLYFTL